MSAYWSPTNGIPRPASSGWTLPRRLSPPARAIGMLMLWQQRAAQRRHLASLDDMLLRDIGIGRTDAARETKKPFWRA
jgi:uncharacterized protein YjiS (DUF1127 family)